MPNIPFRWVDRTATLDMPPPHTKAHATPLRWVRLGAVVIILVVTILLNMAVMGRTQRYLVRQNEDYARQLAFHLNDVLYGEFGYLLQITPDQPLPDIQRLDASVRHILIGLDVTRLAIYDRNGREVYTTTTASTSAYAQGRREASLAEALAGQPMSTFLDATLVNGQRSEHILASYVPIYPAGIERSGVVVGAFAIEQDLSPILDQIQHEQLVITSLVIVLMALLLITLLAGLRWAEHVIVAQHTQLREQNRTLVELQQVRDDLTRLIVHDLRSPLTAIIGYLDMLRLIDNDPQRQEFLRPAIASARTMTHLISTILDLQRLQDRSLPLVLQPVDLSELLAMSAEEYCGWAQRDGKQIQVEPVAAMPTFHADQDLLRRLMGNLLSNALKHTPAGTTIRLAADSDDTGVWMILTIHDDGPGIAPEILPKLFGRYVRGGGRKEGGSTGLGLAFCKLAAEAHGGTIHVDSLPHYGTTFTVRLPLVLPQEPRMIGAHAEMPATNPG